MSKNCLENSKPCVPKESIDDLQVVYELLGNDQDCDAEDTQGHSSTAGQENPKKSLSSIEISPSVDDQIVKNKPRPCNKTTERKGFSRKFTKLTGKNTIKLDNKSCNTRKNIKNQKKIPNTNTCGSKESLNLHLKEMPEKLLNDKDAERVDKRDSHVSTTREISETLHDHKSIAGMNKNIPGNKIKKTLKNKIPLKREKPKKLSDNMLTPSSSGSECVFSEEKSQQLTPSKQKYVLEQDETNTKINISGTEENINTNDPAPNDKNKNLDEASTSFTEKLSNGRSLRMKKKSILYFGKDSDEDPFENVELSNDEYRPDRKRRRVSTLYTADRAIYKNKKVIKKVIRKKSNSKTSKNRGKKHNLDISSIQGEDKGKACPASTIINIDDDNAVPSDVYALFLGKKLQGTNLKIKRLSNVDTRAISSMEIPVIDQSTHKTVEIATQTNVHKTKSKSVQTADSYDISMKTNVSLSAEQAKKAVTFLKDIVKTTSKLGESMAQKSEEFIQKKINTEHVTDTFKMDYCVQKSFLLFKLIKNNVTQMEEGLFTEYENFLTENDMMQYREEPEGIICTLNISDSESDCEIIEDKAET